MAEPINTPLTADIPQLTLDDLLAPLPETQRLGGPGPFVINLSSSSTPVSLPAQGVAGCGPVHFFLVQRIEDRRPRYRLRLGPFATEDEAEAVLGRVRTGYPSALTATADAEDLRVLAAMQARSGTPQPKTEKPLPTLSVIPAAAQVVPSVSLLAVPAPQKPPLSPASQPVQAPKPTQAPKPAQALKPAQAPKPAQALKPAQAAKPAQAVPPGEPLRNLDATQTVRALTQLELEDDQASRWFVIQLALAEQAFDPEHLPNLDIFSAYRLYSVAGIDQGRIVHALRMGFFSDEMGARAVASYLAAYYDNPSIKRVSSAERQRFADRGLEPRKDVGATGKHSVIEITNERFVRGSRSPATVSQKGR